MSRTRRWALRRPMLHALVAAAVLAGAAGCGGSDDEAPAAPIEPAVVPGFDGGAVRVGMLLPASGPVAAVAAERAAGVRAYLDHATTELAGAGGRYPIQVEVRDSADAAGLDAAYAELRDRTVLLAQVDGGAALDALLPTLAADGVLAGVSAPKAELVRRPNLVPVGTPIEVVAANGLAWALDPKGGAGDPAHVCSAAQDGFETQAWQDGLRRAADRLAVELPPTVVIPRATSAPSGARPSVDRLRRSGCTTVLLDAAPAATHATLAAASSSDFAPRWVIPATSASAVITDEAISAYASEHVVTVGDGPVAADPAGLAVVVHVRDLFAPGRAITPAFISGFLLGKAVVSVLDDAVRRGDLSRRSLLAAAGIRRSVSFDDLAPDPRFGPAADRRPPDSSTISAPDATTATGLSPVSRQYTAPFAGDLLAELLPR